jgi:hypothetical protein
VMPSTPAVDRDLAGRRRRADEAATVDDPVL